MSDKMVGKVVRVDQPRVQVSAAPNASLKRVSKISAALALLFSTCVATSVHAGGSGDDDDNAYKTGAMTRGSGGVTGTPIDTTTYPCNKTGTCDSVRDAVTIAAPKCDAQFVYWGPGNSCGANV
jgi:hypothetical protein